MKRRQFLRNGLIAATGSLIASSETIEPATTSGLKGGGTAPVEPVNEAVTEEERRVIGWGWRDVPHGQTLAGDVLGQLVDGDPTRPHFGSYGPNGGPNDHGFFFYAGMGRVQTIAGMAAHAGLGKLAVPDFWNHRVLLFDLHPDGSLAGRRATGLIGQERFDTMEIGHGADRLHFPAACAFDPRGRFLFVADSHNHRVLQFDMSAPQRAIRVYGQPDFDSCGYDATPGNSTRVLRDSLRSLYGLDGPFVMERKTNARGFFLPWGVACDGQRLFVSDCDNHRVMVFDIAGRQNGPAAVAVLGQADFAGHRPNRGGVAGPEVPLSVSADRETLRDFYGMPGRNTMMFPTGLALDRTGRYLLVADCLNFRLLIFDCSSGIHNGMPAIAELSVPGTRERPRTSRPAKRDFKGFVDVVVDDHDRVFVSDREGLRVLVYDLADLVEGRDLPRAAVGRFEFMTDLHQAKGIGEIEGPTALALAGTHLYVAEPRGSRVFCYDVSDPDRRAVNVLGQSYGGNITRPHFNQFGHNDGPNPYGLSFIDGSPALSVTPDGQWLLVADTVGGRLLFFPLKADGLPLDRYARFALGVPSLTEQGSNYGPDRFARPNHSVMTEDGKLFVSDFGGSRVLYFELPDLAAASGAAALQPLRPFVPPDGYISPSQRHPGYRGTRQEFLFRNIRSGVPAKHVLGQIDFETGLREVASERQLGKEISGLALDRNRGWLFVTERHNNRVVIMDVGKSVETFMPCFAVLGQPDFTSNAPYWGRDTVVNDQDRSFELERLGRGGAAAAPVTTVGSVRWHPAGLKDPTGGCFDHVTGMFFVVNDGREILGFDLSGEVTNGMEPVLRIGGPHSTVATDLPRVGSWIAIDEANRRLWSEWFALDLSGDIRRSIPVVGHFGLGFDTRARFLEGTDTARVANLLGYSVGFCHRFGGTINAVAVNPRTGTVYFADNPRFRVLCFQPEFQFESEPLTVTNGQPAVGLTGTGGMAPLEFMVDSGELPHGLTIDSETGVVTGVPRDRPGEYRLGLRVKTATGETRGSRTIILHEGSDRAPSSR